MKYALILALLFTLGCGKSLKKDPSPPAIDSGYNTAEFSACGQKWVGEGFCSILEGQPLSSINFAIQGFYSGRISIESEDCDVREDFRYEDNANVAYSIAGSASKTCHVTFTVSPEYPQQKNQDLQIYSLKGFLLIKVLKGSQSWSASIRKKKTGMDNILYVNTHASSDRVLLSGCGQTIDEPAGERVPVFPVTFQNTLKNYCVGHGAVWAEGEAPQRFSVIVSTYNADFNALPTPAISYTSKKIKITGIDAVSVIALDNEYEVDNEARFTFNKDADHVVRLITVKGRLVLGEYSAATKLWTWKK